MKEWSATIWGKPLVWKKPCERISRLSGKSYVPALNRPACAEIQKQIIAQNVRVRELFTGPLVVLVSFYKRRPKSLAKRVIHVLTSPDVDNSVKIIFDAFNQFVWDDDRQVVLVVASKHYAVNPIRPRTEVTVWELEETEAGWSAGDILQWVLKARPDLLTKSTSSGENSNAE